MVPGRSNAQIGTKKRLIIPVALLLALAVGIVWIVPALYFPIKGWLFGEAFYQGWPTSFWVCALKEDSSVRAQMPPERAAKILSEGDPSAVPVVIAMLRDKDIDVRQQAMQILSAIGPPPETVLPALVDAFERETEPRFCAAAELYLRRIDRAEMTKLLAVVLQRSRLDAARIWAVQMLAIDSEPAETVALLEQALQDSHPRVRVQAVHRLAEFSKQSPGALAALRKALADQELQVRLLAAEYLWDIDGDAKPVLPVLLEAIRSHEGAVHYQIAAILRDLGSDASAARAELCNLLSADDPSVRMRAAQALGSVGVDQSVLPALIERLKDGSPGVRAAAARALRDSSAKEAVPSLLALLTDTSAHVRGEAVMALGHVKPASAETVASIRELLSNDSTEYVRRHAIMALGAIGPQAKNAVPDVVAALSDQTLSFYAVEALAAIGPAARAAIPPLVARLSNADDWDRLCAADALWQIEGSAERVLPIVLATLQRSPIATAASADAPGGKADGSIVAAGPPLDAIANGFAVKLLCKVEPKKGYLFLRRTIKSRNVPLRAYAVRAAKELGPEAKPAARALMEILDDPEILPEVIEALGALGPSAAEALPRLQVMVKQAAPPIKRAADRAIRRIQGVQ